MANKQIIFVVETNDKKQIDDIYIKKFINAYYDLSDNRTTFKFVHMGGKANYKNRSVTSKINKYINENEKGINIIIYCFDTDRIDVDNDAVQFLKEVRNYCDSNSYEFVWFCYEIENVFLGRSVSNEQKVCEAIKYKKKDIYIEDKFISNLSTDDDKKMTKTKSNIIIILNKYFKKF